MFLSLQWIEKPATKCADAKQSNQNSLTFLITRGFNPLLLFAFASNGLKPHCYKNSLLSIFNYLNLFFRQTIQFINQPIDLFLQLSHINSAFLSFNYYNQPNSQFISLFFYRIHNKYKSYSLLTNKNYSVIIFLWKEIEKLTS